MAHMARSCQGRIANSGSGKGLKAVAYPGGTARVQLLGEAGVKNGDSNPTIS